MLTHLAPTAALLTLTAMLGCSRTAAPSAVMTLPTPDPAGSWDEISDLVRERFLDPNLNGLDWEAISAETAAAIEADPDDGPAHIRAALQLLEDGHTQYFVPTQRAYYELLDVFNPNGIGAHPFLPEDALVRYVGVGLVSEEIEGRMFAADVYPGGPADEAGIMVGDELVSTRGGSWGDVAPFLGCADQPVAITIRRHRHGPTTTLTVTPRWIQPRAMFLDAIERDARVIERDGLRLAYVRARSHAHQSYGEAIEDLLSDRLSDADGLIFDFRGGWGGQSLNYLRIFNPAYPDLAFVTRDGERRHWWTGWSKPIVGLVDRGSRSSKDILAYVFKERAGITLVGETTAGAMTGGSPFVLRDGSLLYLGVLDFRVDGMRLEGHGIKPDIAVDRPIPYGAGADPQIEAAARELVRQLRARNADEESS